MATKLINLFDSNDTQDISNLLGFIRPELYPYLQVITKYMAPTIWDIMISDGGDDDFAHYDTNLMAWEMVKNISPSQAQIIEDIDGNSELDSDYLYTAMEEIYLEIKSNMFPELYQEGGYND